MSAKETIARIRIVANDWETFGWATEIGSNTLSERPRMNLGLDFHPKSHIPNLRNRIWNSLLIEYRIWDLQKKSNPKTNSGPVTAARKVCVRSKTPYLPILSSPPGEGRSRLPEDSSPTFQSGSIQIPHIDNLSFNLIELLRKIEIFQETPWKHRPKWGYLIRIDVVEKPILGHLHSLLALNLHYGNSFARYSDRRRLRQKFGPSRNSK
jgi:hypothetical protein